MTNSSRSDADKPFISPTQVSLYLRCGEAYRRRYIEKHVIPPGIALIKGTSLHKGAEVNFKQKIDSRIDLPDKDVIAVAVDTFENTVKHEGISLNQEEEGRGKSVVLGEAKDTTVKFTKMLMEGVAPRYQPAEVEQETKVELPNSTHDLKGIIDLKTEEGNIVDIKTSAKSWDQARLDKDPQFTFYAMLDRAKNGEGQKPLILENLVDTKTPKVNTLQTTRTMEDYDLLINRINRVIDGVNKGVFNPASSDSWMCSERFCGYWATCKVRI